MAYDRTYTGTPGQPRQQFLMGGTWTIRPPWRKAGQPAVRN
jgi:hypothetical protein